jgi:hypothetical protein
LRDGITIQIGGVQKRVDKSVVPYINYLCDQSEKELTGKTAFELNWFKGGITNMNRENKPLPGVQETESVRL